MSEITSIDVNAATRDEMLEYAREELGLSVKASITKSDLQQLIAGQVGQGVNPDAQTKEYGAEEKRTMADLRRAPKVKIRIHDAKSGSDRPLQRVPVSINGVDFTIKPGVIVEVPAPVVEVLRNAKQISYTQEFDDRGRIVTKQTEGLQFPFEIVP